MTDEKNVKLFQKYRIFTETEVHSRYEIKMEGYCKVIGIEALTMLELTRKQILPAVSAYAKELSETVIAKKTACPAASCEMEEAVTRSCESAVDIMAARTPHSRIPPIKSIIGFPLKISKIMEIKTRSLLSAPRFGRKARPITPMTQAAPNDRITHVMAITLDFLTSRLFLIAIKRTRI